MKRITNSMGLHLFLPIGRNWRTFCSLAVVVGWFLLGVSRAEATCGDYLSHGQGRVHNGVPLHHKLVLGGSESEDQTPARAPCHGPSCGKAPVQAPPTIPLVTAEQDDRCLWISTIGTLADGQASFFACPSDAIGLPSISARLDRPPKSLI